MRQVLPGKPATVSRILWTPEGRVSFKATELGATCTFQAHTCSGSWNVNREYLGFKSQY